MAASRLSHDPSRPRRDPPPGNRVFKHPIFKVWHLESQPALIIGMNVPGSVDALVLDYPRARLYMRPVPPKGISRVGIDDVVFPDPGFNDGGG
ncbi:MAG: hypothetical protein HIU85_16645 [Proteobacteria bacterium]|nr:hypothetical protein [Pseudomonadota bacterium]